MLFVPAFPEGGRTTRGGVHYVRVGDRRPPGPRERIRPGSGVQLLDGSSRRLRRGEVGAAGDSRRRSKRSEPANSPKSSPRPRPAPSSSPTWSTPKTSPPSRVPWTTSQREAAASSSAAPRPSPPSSQASPAAGLLPTPLVDRPERVLLVCGSHTLGAGAQLAPIAEAWGPPAVVDTATALDAPTAAGLEAADAARVAFAGKPVVLLATERDRAAEHNTLDHGERVMAALTTAVASLLPEVGVVVAKGGITSAEVARTGIGATSAFVLGQVLPGVSVWRMSARDGREVLFIVVPGNVGGPDTLTRVLAALDGRVTTS